MSGFTIGADPEVFFEDGEGLFVSAIGKLGGTKESPRSIGVGAVQEDGVAAEFNITPQTTAEGFSSNIQAMLDTLEEMAKSHQLILSKKAFAEFPATELQHPLSQIAGCDPDLNAWLKATNEMPCIAGTNHRAVGGHVHIGHRPNSTDLIANFIKTLDLYLAVPAVMVEDVERKKLYGKAGSFRIKDYGVEYRTLSNFWVFSHARRVWVYLAIKKSIERYKTIIVHDSVQEIINSGDVTGAKDIMAQYNILPVPEGD